MAKSEDKQPRHEDMKTTQESEALKGRMAVALPEGPDLKVGSVVELMVMPAGTHTCFFGQGGKSAQRTVIVDALSAKAMQDQLLAVNSKSRRAFFDFDHEGKAASGWPLEYVWRSQPEAGVFCRTELSEAGAAAIRGKTYRSFSPVIYATKKPDPARIYARKDPELSFGGLVNDPAFEEISPLWAKRAAAAATQAGAQLSSEQTKDKNRLKDKQDMAALQARRTVLEQEIDGLKADSTQEGVEALNARRTELTTVEAQIEAGQAQAKNAELEQALLGQRTKDADAAVKDAIRRGVLAAKDEALHGKWRGWCTENPEMIEALKGMKGSAALTQPRLTIQGVKIMREDSAAVLTAFGNERDPGKRAALYAKEIKPRLAEGDDLPLKGATVTSGTVAGTLVTQRTLELLKFSFPVLSSISNDFSDQPGHYNQTINTRIVGVPSVVAYDSGGAGTGWADQDVTFTDVNIKLARQAGVPITFTSQLLSSTARRLFDEIAPAQAYALAKDMVDALYAKITAANFTNTATKAAQIDFGRASVIDMGTALTKRGVPQGSMNRTLLLSPDYFGQLSKDQAIVTLAAYQKAEIIEQGVLPNVHGFKVIEAANLPSTGNLCGFGFSRSALCIASRLDNDYTNVLPGASYGNSQVVTDPDLGISVLQVQFVNHILATATQRISLIYGVSGGLLGGASGAEPGGQDNAGQRLTSA